MNTKTLVLGVVVAVVVCAACIVLFSHTGNAGRKDPFAGSSGEGGHAGENGWNSSGANALPAANPAELSDYVNSFGTGRSEINIDQGGIGKALLSKAFCTTIMVLNHMSAENRRLFVEMALRDLETSTGTGLNPLDPSLSHSDVRDIVASGMKAFYETASPAVKQDLSPVIERIESRLNEMR